MSENEDVGTTQPSASLAVFQYSAGSHPDYHIPDARYEFPPKQPTYGKDWRLVVTDLAEDFHSNHDGWECSWPVEFRIYECGVEVARFDVERETVPAFYARSLKPSVRKDAVLIIQPANRRDL